MIDDARRKAAYDKVVLQVNKRENIELLKPHVKLHVFYGRFASYEGVRDLFKDTLSDNERQALLTFARDLPTIQQRIAEKTDKKVHSSVCDRLSELSDMEIASRMDQITDELERTFFNVYSQPIKSLSRTAQQAIEQYIEANVKPGTTHSTWTALAQADIEVFREDISSFCMHSSPSPVLEERSTQEHHEQPPNQAGPQPAGRLPSARDPK